MACAERSAELSESHAAAIRDSVRVALADFNRYSAASQWDSMVAVYSNRPEFRWVENGLVRYRSPADIRAALSALPPGARVDTKYDDTEVTPLAPGVASVFTLFETRLGEPGAAFAGFEGAMTITFVHEDAGWRMLAGHTSSAPIQR
jgi:hypothetical protein